MPDPTTATVWTTMTLVDFVIGIAGNLIARHGDPTVNSLATVIYQRLATGGLSLPPNHDVERGCRTALQQALKMLAQAIEFQVQRPKTWLGGLRNSHDEEGRWKPLLSRMQTAEGIWFDEFVSEIQSDEALKTFRIPVGDASSLNDAMRNETNAPQAELFRLALVDWTERHVQKGTRPRCFDEFIGDKQPPNFDRNQPRGIGWPMNPDTPGVRVTLYQVWSLFLQDYLKKNQEVFRILTVDWLASIDSRLKEGLFNWDDFVAAVQKPLGEFKTNLIALHDDMARLLEQVDGVSVSIGELLPLVIAFREDVGQGFEGLRTEVDFHRKKLSAIAVNTEESLQMQVTSLQDTAAIRSQLDRIETSLAPNVASVQASVAVSSIANPFPPNAPRVDRTGFVDCRDAFDAFETLMNPNNEKRVLLLEGEGEHGKSELTTRFHSHAQVVLPPYSTAYIRFIRPVKPLLRYLDLVIDSLGRPVAKTGRWVIRNRRLIEARDAIPTVLFVDAYEHSEDEHRLWLGEFLESVPLRRLLRLVIAGRRVPSHRSQIWAEQTVHVQCDPFREPDAFVQHGTNCRSKMPAEEIRDCCKMLKKLRDGRKQNGLPTDGLSPLTLIGEINRRCDGENSV